ncbi:MAG: YceI family protein [Sorangiineae bacterium]|nr:YceI family protein [Polyangiaceae bacterium]MEB2321336.1 YceI family protein [Sorangiineae bacterium]
MSQVNWDFDHAHSSVNFWVRHLMVSKVRGRFATWDGTLSFDPDDLTTAKLEVTIDAGSIETREEKRDAHLRSPDFLDAEKFPKLTFKSSKIEKKSGDKYALSGDLTIRGVTKPVTLDVEYSGTVTDPWGGSRAGFSASTSLNRRDFGLEWNQALEAGGVLVGDKVNLDLEIEVMKQKAS